MTRRGLALLFVASLTAQAVGCVGYAYRSGADSYRPPAALAAEAAAGERPVVMLVTGSMIVAEFDSLQAAQQWAEADPYVAAGVYNTVDVRPFKRVL